MLAWIYSEQDYHNLFTHNCKLSHGEWKELGLNIHKPNTKNWSTFCRFGLNLFKPSRWFVRVFNTILFTIVGVFWLGFIQDKITINFWTITANYLTVNGKPLAWVFSSQILEIEAPFSGLAWIYSSQAGVSLVFWQVVYSIDPTLWLGFIKDKITMA
jgi:hypothetical protein